MKKNYLLLSLIALTVLFAACDKDKDTKPSVEQQLTGKWKETTYNYKMTSSDNSVNETESGNSDDNLFIEFKSDKTGTFNDNGDIENFTWSYSNNKIKVTQSGDVSEFDVKSISNTNLTLFYKDSFTYNNVTYSYEMTTNYVKQ